MPSAARCSRRNIRATMVFLLSAVLFAVGGALVGATPASTSPARQAGNPGGYQVRLLAAAPTNPSQVVAIADYYPDDYKNSCARIGEYVLMSGDGGQTWQVSATLPYVGCKSGGLLDVALLGDGTLLAKPSSGNIIRSGDEGKTWVTVKNADGDRWPDGFVSPIIADPSRPSSAWTCSERNYGSHRSNGRVLRTDDGGKHWRTMKSFPIGCEVQAIQPHGGVVIVRKKTTGSRGWLFRSTDRGIHWKRVPIPCTKPSVSTNPKCWVPYVVSEGGSMRFDPARPKIVIAYAVEKSNNTDAVVYRSSDAGLHWKPAALVAGLRNRGIGRVYTGSQFRLGNKSWFVDTHGRRLYPRVSYELAGLFNYGGAFIVGDGLWNPANIFIKSKDHGRSWSIVRIKNNPWGVGALGYPWNAGTQDKILAYSAFNEPPSALWHFRLNDRTWRKVPLGISVPATTTTTTL